MQRYETSIGVTGLQFYPCEHGRWVQHSDAESAIAAAVAAERERCIVVCEQVAQTMDDGKVWMDGQAALIVAIRKIRKGTR